MSNITRTYACDFEVFYDSECSITVQGVWGYLRHPKADIYLVSIVGTDGTKWVGNPKDFDWATIAGPGTRWIFHNLAFDFLVYERLVELYPHLNKFRPEECHCTADMAAYHGIPRNLKGAIEAVLPEITVSKDTRNAMKGKQWADMDEDFRKEVCEYALHDSICCLKLWEKLSPTWPEHERVISRSTAQISIQGIPVNRDKIEESIQTLKDQAWEAEQSIPWSGTHPTLSPKQLAETCRRVGIEPPRSLAQDSEECAEWEDKYGEQFPWVNAMRTYRRTNMLRKKFEAMLARTRPDGRMDAGLLYCGAHTLRDSGTGGVNLQNMPRLPMFGTNMRECIEAPPGRTFVINDLSQIEPRVLAWLAKDTGFLDIVATGVSPYEAHARSSMGWTGGKLKDESPSMYGLSKARILALGYGAGWEKFIMMAGNYVDAATFAQIFHVKPTDEDRARFVAYLMSQESRNSSGKLAKFEKSTEVEQWTAVNSWVQVMDYRKSNPKIVAFWDRLDRAFRSSIGQDLKIELPSGRNMTYRKIQRIAGSTTCAQVRNGSWMRTKLYGGLGAENITQSLARDVFMNCVHRILRLGHMVILRVHDEVVIECDIDKAEAVLAEVSAIMHTPPDWLPELPVASEGQISRVYLK